MIAIKASIASAASLRGVRMAAAGLLLAAALGGGSSVVDNSPTSMGGLPEGVPPRPATQPAYPAVHDLPRSRQDAALSEAESNRLREELKGARNKIAVPPADAAADGGARNP
jgi:hypothetical protein